MAMNIERFQELIRDLYRIVGELSAMFDGRPFTLDGHMVGSLAECYAAYHYDLTLNRCSTPSHDAIREGRNIEIKATQAKKVALRSGPEFLLVFRLNPNGSFDEIYNGPGAPVWALVANRKSTSNGQHQVSLIQLSQLMTTVRPEHRIQRMHA